MAHDLPESTYRLQFHAGFTFRDATALVPYLHDLGVTHCYASPYLKARPGSNHGYDVIDHDSLNAEVGSEADFDAWVGALRHHGMGHVLDVVPNHMGVATNDNRWWNDLLEHGPESKYAKFFDIAWEGSPRPELHGKVLLPVLGEPYGKVLEKGELKLVRHTGGAAVEYYDKCFPIDPKTLPPEAEIASFNGTPGEPRSYDRLHELLEKQHYRLAYWQTAPDEINYRRFFDVNDLAALSMEWQEVFDAAHRFTLKLIADGKIDGLRVDHPDGLYDPKQYFDRLRAACARATGRGEPFYVVAEKILAVDEPLPQRWAVHGTSGYDFLNMANGLFVDRANEAALTRLYQDFVGDDTPFEEIVYRKKKLILQISLASELHMLAHQLDRLAQRHRLTRDFTLNGLLAALREVIACFPVYRSYVSSEGVTDADVAHVETAVREAARRSPATDPSVFHFVRDAVLQKYPDTFTQEDKAAQLRFAGKFQQVNAPTTAKGIEDTAFYIYNRLVSLNEVGGEPAHFGVSPAELHAYFAERQKLWPHAMSALSTHDTKRSEDVRARLNVLSETPDEWRRAVESWRDLNERHRRPVRGEPAPHRNDEYLLYQTLVGAWPLEPHRPGELARFVKRMQAYMEKAMREAKVRTGWVQPNTEYEAAVKAFVDDILDGQKSRQFLDAFRPFQRRVSDLGMINSLSQTLLRLIAPGVPDTYQGMELWDFSLVDPDNRRPVDYERRRRVLAELKSRVEREGADRRALARELVDGMQDGRAKLYVTWQALQARKAYPGLFTRGDYLLLDVTGARPDCLFAFARRLGDVTAVVIAPRLVAGMKPAGDMRLSLPDLPAGVRLRNVFTGNVVAPQRGTGTNVSELLGEFPVALLVSEQ
jgi:(1->4)-alpha-D-glucan 1-alpha-D-glucosylmutase